jgi:hypothetical protein
MSLSLRSVIYTKSHDRVDWRQRSRAHQTQ